MGPIAVSWLGGYCSLNNIESELHKVIMCHSVYCSVTEINEFLHNIYVYKTQTMSPRITNSTLHGRFDIRYEL